MLKSNGEKFGTGGVGEEKSKNVKRKNNSDLDEQPQKPTLLVGQTSPSSTTLTTSVSSAPEIGMASPVSQHVSGVVEGAVELVDSVLPRDEVVSLSDFANTTSQALGGAQTSLADNVGSARIFSGNGDAGTSATSKRKAQVVDIRKEATDKK